MSSYYISRKSFSVWMSLLFTALAFSAGLSYYMSVPCHSLIRTTGIAALPVAAAFFGLFVLIFGNKRFGITILPVIMGCISFTIASVGQSVPAVIVCRIFCILAAIVYVCVIFNVIKTNTLLVYIFGVAMVSSIVIIYMNRNVIGANDISAFSAIMSMFFISLGMRRNFGDVIVKWSDRANGRQIRSMPPMSRITPYFMPDRIGAQNLIREQLELDEIEKYIAKKRQEGLKGFGFMHVFITAYLRVVAMYPGVNRYLSGQKVFSRFNCIIAFVVKKDMTVESPDTVVKADLKPGLNSKEVYEKIAKIIEENKGNTEDSSFDSVAKMLNYVPGIFLKLAVWLLKVLDYFGLLPTALEEVSPFHASMFFTSVGSIGIPVIFHHLYNFGNVPVFCAFGKKYKKNELQSDGTVIAKKYIDYTCSADERICDGYYFSLVLRQLKKILSQPEILDSTLEPVADIK